MPTATTAARTVHLLGVPMDLGSGRRGVDMGPSAIRIAGVAERLGDMGLTVVDGGDIAIKNMEEAAVGNPRARYLREIARASAEVSGRVQRILAKQRFPLILGGDHSIAVGTISGVAAQARRKRRRVGILWVDAHGDMNTPATSPSGNIHGMPLAAILGRGPKSLTQAGGAPSGVAGANVALVGIRSLDEGERQHLRALGVHVFTMREIDRVGIHKVMEQALARVTDGTDALHVSFDLDAVDPSLAPGVGTPVKGGLDYREAHFVMETVADSGRMTSLEMVEVNPILDRRNTSAELAVELIESAFGKRIL